MTTRSNSHGPAFTSCYSAPKSCRNAPMAESCHVTREPHDNWPRTREGGGHGICVTSAPTRASGDHLTHDGNAEERKASRKHPGAPILNFRTRVGLPKRSPYPVWPSRCSATAVRRTWRRLPDRPRPAGRSHNPCDRDGLPATRQIVAISTVGRAKPATGILSVTRRRGVCDGDDRHARHSWRDDFC
jgi:hypothetical protein